MRWRLVNPQRAIAHICMRRFYKARRQLIVHRRILRTQCTHARRRAESLLVQRFVSQRVATVERVSESIVAAIVESDQYAVLPAKCALKVGKRLWDGAVDQSCVEDHNVAELWVQGVARKSALLHRHVRRIAKFIAV